MHESRSETDPAGPTHEGSVGELDIELPAVSKDPTSLGRYRILGVLGRGGMSVVYSAEDPELERVVALKVLSPKRHGDQARARLQREAKTLAKLAHPNVVAIHDVGEHQGQLYITMERIDGRTLYDWMRAPRPWSEILAMFVATGRGLVAAHEAGLVHRDFKPENVLVDDRGVPRVVDFGLARIIDDTAADGRSSTDPAAERHGGDQSRALTRTGAVMGTPAYMAPEQHLGDPSDARTDQFAFCVALWEALYGERPFAGKTSTALAHAVISGRVSLGPSRGVPRRIRRALLRGLAVDPRRRWPSLAELLDALAAVPRQRRIIGRGALASVIIGGLITGTWAFASRFDDESAKPCDDTSVRIDAVWSVDRRAALDAALVRVGGEALASNRALLLDRLDHYADALRLGFEEACLDTELRRLVSAELRDRRISCLSSRVEALDATVGLLESSDRENLHRALGLLDALPSIDRCADMAYLEARLPAPEDPADAERVAEARSALARAAVAVTAVRISEANAAIERAEQLATSVEHPPLAAELSLMRGKLGLREGSFETGAERVRDAYHAALAIGHDEVAIEATLELTYAYHELHEPERGLDWARHAQSMIDRAGDQRARAILLHRRAVLTAQLGEPEQATALYQQAIELWERIVGPTGEAIAPTLESYANVLVSLDRFAEARKLYERALAIRLEHYGELSAVTALSFANFGVLLWMEGEFEASVDFQRRALAGLEYVHGPKHPRLVGALANLARALNSVGQPEQALATVERGVEIVRVDDPPNPGVEAKLLSVRAYANCKLGRFEAARDDSLRELELIAELHGHDSPKTIPALVGLARASNGVGEHARALEYTQRTFEVQGHDHHYAGDRAGARLVTAQAYLALGKRALAREHALLAQAEFAEADECYRPEREQTEALLAKIEGLN